MIEILMTKQRNYSMETLFKQIGYSRQQYHQLLSRQQARQEQNEQIFSTVMKWREYHPQMGGRILYHSIINSGEELGMGITKFEQLLSEHQLTVGKTHSRNPKTSDGKGKESYPNLVNGLEIKDINKVVVGDITYYMVEGKWHYVFTLKDVYSQNILGLQASKNMEHIVALNCLNQMMKERGKQAIKGCIHHTDNGSQYNANEYKRQLLKLKMQISRATSCQENGSAEQLNHIIKNMYFDGWAISTFKELVEACQEFKYLNNHQRSIKQLGYISPVEFEKQIKNIPLKSRVIKKLYNFTNGQL